jgi:phage-related protein
VKQLIWIGSSHEDLKDFPPRICSAMGYALYQAQTGKRHEHAKTMSEMGNASMQEIREKDLFRN